MKEVVIDSGIPSHEIKKYFKKRTRIYGDNRFIGEGWEVAMEILGDQGYKNLPLPRTRLVFKGEEKSVILAVQEYRRAFLRGGA